MSAHAMARKAEVRSKNGRRMESQGYGIDILLLFAVLSLLGLGIVMVGSASLSIADREFNQPFFYLVRQVIYVGIGLALAAVVVRVRLEYLQRASGILLIASVLTLALVLVPGVGHEVNGSARWLSLGVFNLQPSEFVKLLALIYLAGYLVRRSDEVRTAVGGFVKPMLILTLICTLLLAEPDFGAAAVMLTTAMGMMFLGGVRIWQFGVLIVCVAVALATLIFTSPYRLERLTPVVFSSPRRSSPLVVANGSVSAWATACKSCFIYRRRIPIFCLPSWPKNLGCWAACLSFFFLVWW